MSYSSNELRQLFLKFFEERGHRIIPSSSLVPENDSSVLFTTAGMQQFKLYYSGKKDSLKDIHLELGEPLKTTKVTTCQKCIRTTDISSVGDVSHLTFFEMLGNFSFGGYFKKEAIYYAWEFIHQQLGIDPERITITVFGGDKDVPFDEESFNIWKELGLEGKIEKGNREDNFWGPTGTEGPCGPTTEIYVDGIEIWNLVFNEYYQNTKGDLSSLPKKGVDTGMGLERLCLVMQYPHNRTKTIFDTDVFQDLMVFLRQNSLSPDKPYAYRIIADHLRSSIFLSAAGVLPSNLGRGYILRRLLRRMIRYAHLVNMKKEWLQPAIKLIVDKYSNFYPELKQEEEIYKVIKEEDDKFQQTLERGLKELRKLFSKLENNKETMVSGEKAFYLYESYGFPLELIEEVAQQSNFQVDKDGFEKKFQEHRKISRAGKTKKFGGHGLKGDQKYSEVEKQKVIRSHTATHLLLAALRNIINPDITQKGSDITPERLRLDFSCPRKVTPEELKKIEDWVNNCIAKNVPVTSYETTYDQAVADGALGSFRDRYPKKVRVYTIEDEEGNIYSKEICAGPHVKNTKDIGHFRIIKEKSAAQGIRRIKAVVEP